jgi:ABC-type bacteriocin/lantibiotic exporter with double-glycine peptidase domain
MILSHFGIEIAEAELRHLCDCTFDGTDALKAVDAARKLGFPGTGKHNLTIDELASVVTNGQFPIVFLDLTPIYGFFQSHTVIVTAISTTSVQLLDPARGEYLLPSHVFNNAWSMRRNLSIVFEK